MVEHDGHVGQLLDKLDELGITDNTIVMYSTDNGAEVMSWPDGGSTPFRGEKDTNYEGGWRVPCAIRWPGMIKPGPSRTRCFRTPTCSRPWPPPRGLFFFVDGQSTVDGLPVNANRGAESEQANRVPHARGDGRNLVLILERGLQETNGKTAVLADEQARSTDESAHLFFTGKTMVAHPSRERCPIGDTGRHHGCRSRR